jgi:hypothetical protein
LIDDLGGTRDHVRLLEGQRPPEVPEKHRIVVGEAAHFAVDPFGRTQASVLVQDLELRHDPEAKVNRLLQELGVGGRLEEKSIEAGIAQDAQRRVRMADAVEKYTLAGDQELAAIALDDHVAVARTR